MGKNSELSPSSSVSEREVEGESGIGSDISVDKE